MFELIMKPVINNNGMTADEHIRLRIAARTAVMAAIKAIGELRPHGRDYQTATDPLAYETDRLIHDERISQLDKLHNTLLDEALFIQEQAK